MEPVGQPGLVAVNAQFEAAESIVKHHSPPHPHDLAGIHHILQFATLIQIEIPQRFFSGLVFGLFKGFPELTVKQFRLGFLVVRALSEQGFATIGFLLQKLRGKVKVRPLVLLHWRLVEQYFPQFGVHRQRGSAARTDHFELSRFLLAS